MREVLSPQLSLDEINIGAIKLDPRSRDDIPQLLRGLQHIYVTPQIRAEVFEILKDVVPESSDGKGKASVLLGRPGMEQWRILVLGTMRLCLNADYDRMMELANEHKNLRKMLGHTGWKDEHDDTDYTLQTLKDNLRLFTPDVLGRINEVVVRAGHDLIKKNFPRSPDGLSTRIDSFVVETDVHYPTDASLLLDAIRKVVTICARLSKVVGSSEWRQHRHNVRTFKRQCRKISRLKRSTARDEAKRAAREQEIQQAYGAYIEEGEKFLQRARETQRSLENGAKRHFAVASALHELDRFMKHAERQIDQIRRRVLKGETIPHEEKVFSIFEEHTEWIAKGKAGVPVELGLKVAVLEDQHRFILNYRILEHTEDVEAAVPLIEDTRARYGTLKSASFDKGFHSADNQSKLENLVGQVVMPKKGKLSAVDLERESDPQFVRLRQKHAAVESAINALEHHGLDRVLDYGIVGFKRYVAFAILARNILRVGQILYQRKAHRKRAPLPKAA